MTAENRDELRNALEMSLAEVNRTIAELPDPLVPAGPELAHTRALSLAALVNLEHLEHSIRASREHEAQGSELLALFRESSVSPGDFGRAMVILAQIVSWLEDPDGPFELDREDRDTESAARLLGFLEPDPVEAPDNQGPAPASPDWSRRAAPEPTLADGTPVSAAIADAERATPGG